MDGLFKTIDEILKIVNKVKDEVIVWGTKDYAIQVFHTLKDFNITVSYFADNDKSRHGQILYGIPVVSFEQVKVLRNPIIIIGSLWYQAIYEQLSIAGMKRVYALTDCLKYPLSVHQTERQEMEELFNPVPSVDARSGRILIELYGNIGDVLIKVGILKWMIESFGMEKVYILVDMRWNDANASLVSLLTDKVITIDRFLFAENKNYRIKLLRYLNSCNFQYSISLCNISLHSRRRCLNRINFNVKNILMERKGHFHQYVQGHDIDFIRKLYSIPDSVDLSCKNVLNHEVERLNFRYFLPERFVCLAMGASSQIRCYDYLRFSIIVRYLVDEGYDIVFLGYGQEDQEYYKKLLNVLENNYASKIISFISKLTVRESLFVILKSAFFVGVESGMWNASYMLGKKSVVIYGGGDYGDFRHEEPGIFYVTVKENSCFYCKWFCTNKNERGMARCIDDITPDMILEQIRFLQEEIRG